MTRPLRADAARNRERLLTAAAEVLGERGLDAPLEEIARRAKVSIGTLYNHFPTREALCDALLPERLTALDRIAAEALADPDPWRGFTRFLDGLFALQAEDQAVNDALARRVPVSEEMRAACGRGLGHAERIIRRAQDGGGLRADFTVNDLAPLLWAMSQVIRESMTVAPQAWRRHLAFVLAGLRAEAAGPLPAPPLTDQQLSEVLRGR